VISFTDCPFDESGRTISFAQEFIETEAPDGFISDGETFRIVEEGYDIGTYTFAYPVFTIDYFDQDAIFTTLETHFSAQDSGVSRVELFIDYDSDDDGENDAVCFTEAAEPGFPG
jgi:hypothetical protein